MYTKSDIKKVRDTVDITEFLEKRGFSFKQTGTSRVGLCPIHNEKSGSFHIKPDTNTFHCFGCGAGGDVISLVQQMEGLSFTGAIQMLAEEYGIEIESAESDPEFKKLQRLYKICQLASRWYRDQYVMLPSDHPAKKNLADRMLNGEGDKDPTIGFAPMQGLLDVLFKERFSKEEIAETGLIKINEEGKVVQLFRNRLVWTINDAQGRPIAFSARKLFEEDNGPKYINSPATRLYNKSKTLMGLDIARKHTHKTQSIYVVEGATDIMAFRAAGFPNVVATCGTAFGPEHANVVLGLANATKDANRFIVYFCFDGDAAGLEAAKKVFNKNKSIISISNVIKFDNGDPCDIRLQGGDNALQTKVKTGGVPIVEFMLKEELVTWDLNKPEDVAKFIEAAKTILKNLNSNVEVEAYMRKISSWTGVSMQALNSSARVQQSITDSAQPKISHSFYDTLFALLLQHPDVVLPLIEKYNISPEYFDDSSLAKKVIAIAKDEAESDADVSKYLVMPTGSSERSAMQAEVLIKNLLKSLYTSEINALNQRINDSASDEDESLELFMNENDKLKKKYHI